MEDKKEQRQKKALLNVHGESKICLEFVAYADGHISLWMHVDHSVPFVQVEAAIFKMQEHLNSFIEDRGMCPFNPDFKEESGL